MPAEINKIFTKNLCKLLSDRNMTQAELAEKLGVGKSTISMWIKGSSSPRMELLDKIADFFGVSVGYLMSEEDATTPGYYLNEETAKLAQKMYEDEDMRSLFDMKRNMPPERFKAHMEFMKNLYEQEKGKNT